MQMDVLENMQIGILLNEKTYLSIVLPYHIAEITVGVARGRRWFCEKKV